MKIFNRFILTTFLIFNSAIIGAADVGGNDYLELTMRLNTDWQDVFKRNPHLEKVKKRKNGILTVRGPIKFNFLYEKENILEFDKVKLVIYPVEDSKINYIHIFPQLNNMSSENMRRFLDSIDNNLISLGWKKTQSFEQSDNLVATGVKDSSFYQFDSSSKVNGIYVYEIVLTTFIDNTIKCKLSSEVEKTKDCKNRYIRLGFYGFKNGRKLSAR